MGWLLRLARYLKNHHPWWWPGEDQREFCDEQLVLSEDRIATCELEVNHGYAHKSRSGFRWAA